MKRASLLIAGVVLAAGADRTTAAEPADSAALEFFDKVVRPLLIEKCQSCHGDKKVRGGLRLTGRAAVLKGGDTGPAVVPGKPDQSLLVQVLGYHGDVKMPPAGKLAEADIGKLKRWVALGAPWPETAAPTVRPGAGFAVTEAQRRWWAFQPVRAASPPAVRDAAWPKSDVDRFILAELESRGLAPPAPADKRTLIRRVTFDVTGLPPTPAEIEAFVADASPEAFAKVVDRLLASPAYGQRWARHWLDVVRYADYHDGNPKTRVATCEPMEAWRYRDWVIGALNRDLAFDRFIVHQIAGDLLPGTGGEADVDGLVATTFLSNGSWDRGDADKEKMVSDMVDDQIDTVGKAFLGLTLGCARCHDHKFDPLSHADYYGLAGIFYSTHILKDLGTKGGDYTLNRVPLVPKDVVSRRAEAVKRLDAAKAKLAEFDKNKPKPAGDDPARLELLAQRDKAQADMPPEYPVAEAAQEGGTPGGLFPKIQDVPIHIRGSYARLGPIVPRRMPAFFAGENRPPIAQGSGRRELADWIASRDNPLTARVIVNRVWQWHFGAGLVRSPNNFGIMSEPPSHPALLDWLADRFAADGWSLKKLHRLIVTSAVYGQSARIADCRLQIADLKNATRHDPRTVDPDNRLLWRFSPRRLEAEAIRDAMLVAAGRLDVTGGGPATADLDSPRRSLYVQTARWDRGNFATLFDAANPDASDEKRNVSTVAPQALFLLNHGFVRAQAKLFAERLGREVPADDAARVRRAYELLFARPPTAEEVAISLAVVRGGKGAAGWADLAHVLMCSNEFVYVD